MCVKLIFLTKTFAKVITNKKKKLRKKIPNKTTQHNTTQSYTSFCHNTNHAIKYLG